MKFRAEHRCSTVKDGVEQANVFPYFIGVFDTVAALGNKWLAPIFIAAVLAIPFGLHFLGHWLEPAYPWAGQVMRDLGCLSVIVASLIYLKNYLKIAPPLPGHGFFRRLMTLHLTRPTHQFYDRTLSVNVGYAKHGCGSSREVAAYALADYGIRVVIPSSFGDIFASNAIKNGVLPAQISEEDSGQLLRADELVGHRPLTIDLGAQTIAVANLVVTFSIDPVWKKQLLNGWDDIDMTQSETRTTARFAERDEIRRPWMIPAGVAPPTGPRRQEPVGSLAPSATGRDAAFKPLRTPTSWVIAAKSTLPYMVN